MIEAILANFSHYNFSELVGLLQTPAFYGTILSLIILEATLSCDNAIVLAMCVRHLNPEDQKHALHWGMGGAYLFRFIAIGLGTLLIKLWWVKAIGGAYLLYIALKHFYEMFTPKNELAEQEENMVGKGLIATILTVEMMDIAFSADSVLAAFGVSESVWVLLIGGMLGILTMRFAAQMFVKLLEKVPELEVSAYILILLIGFKMLASIERFEINFPGLGYHMGEWTFIGMMVVIFGGTFVYKYFKNKVDSDIVTYE